MFDLQNISFDEHDLAWTKLSKQEIKDCINSDFNPLDNRIRFEREHPGVRELYLMSNCPEYIYFTGRMLLNVEFSPMQACILWSMWNHEFPMLIGSRGLGKTFILACYALIRASLMQGTKIVCTGSSFRQSKFLFSYIDKIFSGSPILQGIFKSGKDGPKTSQDMITYTLGKSEIFMIPVGDGSKIRGLRGNIIIADEMNSIDTDVYEVVINNFAAVTKDPIKNMQRKAKIKSLKAAGIAIPEDLQEEGFSNQSIIAGTMGFEFQPMYQYWQNYKEIIDTKGKSLKDVFSDIDIDLSYKDFCILRLPYELIDKGYMDDKTIARAKATIHIGAYNSEYGCVPVKDSTGFFRRSTIEACVANESNLNDPGWPDWCPSVFNSEIVGKKESVYVMGIDPASEDDNFSITICEVFPEHQRIVYCWTTTRAQVQAKDPNASYYAYCARHIRELVKKFNIRIIGIDAQGGGRPLAEALHDKTLLQEGEVQFWEAIDPDKPKDSDKMSGEHILKMIEFSNYRWLSNANHNLKKDLEDKTLLFPQYNSIILGLAGDDTPEENNLINIEETKDELSTIVMTSTSTRERWDTPQVKTDSNKIGRMRKDRYSSLLIANDMARNINKEIKKPKPSGFFGAVVGGVHNDPNSSKKIYSGNSNYANKARSSVYRKVR